MNSLLYFGSEVASRCSKLKKPLSSLAAALSRTLVKPPEFLTVEIWRPGRGLVSLAPRGHRKTIWYLYADITKNEQLYINSLKTEYVFLSFPFFFSFFEPDFFFFL